MKKYYKIILALFTYTSLSGCFMQLPAPISYNDATSLSDANNSDIESSLSVSPLPVNSDGQLTQQNINPQFDEKPSGNLQDPSQYDIDDENVSYYEVVQGDTLSSIAAAHGISIEVLANANDFAVTYIPQEMELIKIPAPTAKKSSKSFDLDSELNSLGAVTETSPVQKQTVMPDIVEKHSAVAPQTSFIVPLKGHLITKFGQATPYGKSNGVNITAPQGSPIYNSASGKVVYSGFDAKFGNLVIVQTINDKMFLAYAHMDNLIVRKGQDLMQGEIIGHVGSTGEVQHPQLHFAIRKNKQPVDPLKFIDLN